MQTMIRLWYAYAIIYYCVSLPISHSRASSAISSPSKAVENIDQLRCDTPLANVHETSLVVYHLRILVLRRLYVPHGLPAAPCPMSTSLLNSEVCTLSATALISPSAPCRASGR
jgi:hypothetical protein